MAVQSEPQPSDRPLSFQTVQLSPRWGIDVALTDVLAAVSAAGFRHVGLDHWSADAFAPDGELGPLVDLLAAHSLTCTDLCALVIGPDAGDNVAQAKRFAALARATGASRCATAVADTVADPLTAEVAASVAECAAVLNDSGVRLAVEYLPYLPIRDVATTSVLCDSVGWDRVGVLVDSWATLVGDQLDAVRRLDGDQIALVQFADARLPLPPGDLTDAGRNHRMIPGHGDLDLHAFVDALTACGYDGPLSVEVLSAAQRARPPAEFAADVFAAASSHWRNSSS